MTFSECWGLIVLLARFLFIILVAGVVLLMGGCAVAAWIDSAWLHG